MLCLYFSLSDEPESFFSDEPESFFSDPWKIIFERHTTESTDFMNNYVLLVIKCIIHTSLK